jgi:hypothetical protein
MAFAKNQSEQNRHFQSGPSHRRYTNGNTHSDIDQNINYHSELDLTYDESLSSIFVTDSSKTLEMNRQNRSSDRTRTSTNTG